MIPIFLERYKNKILQSGKYLACIRECGKEVRYPYEEQNLLKGVFPTVDLETGLEEGGQMMMGEEEEHKGIDSLKSSTNGFYQHIEKAYEWSSKQLIELLFGELDLMKRIESVKHYFFLDRGDFFIHLVDGCEDILESQIHSVSNTKMGSILELAVRTSSCLNDPFKDDITCDLNVYGIFE